MAHEAAEATSGSSEITGMLEHAFRAFGDSLKVATRAQEDTVKFWSEAVSRTNPAGHTVAADWIPAAQKNAEEYLRLLESSYRRNAELLKKAIHQQNGGDGIALERRTSEWLEASMAVARDNAQDLANTNLRMAEAWTEAFKKSAQQVEPQKATAGK